MKRVTPTLQGLHFASSCGADGARMICKFHAAMTAFAPPHSRSLVNPHAASALRVLAVLTMSLLSALPAGAERADRYQPLHYEGDRAEADGLKQVYTLRGNVIITKGSIVIRSDAAQIQQSPEGYASAVVTAAAGKLAQFKQKREGSAETIEGEAERIEYDARSDTVRFVNRAVMRRYRGPTLADEVAGNLITYDNTTEVFSAQGGASSSPESGTPPGRVRGTLTPRNSAPPSTPKPDEAAPAGDKR